MRLSSLALAVLLLSLGTQSGGASTLGVYFDSQAQICDATIPIFTQDTWYVCARLYGDAGEDGMTAAEFRIIGFPSGWLVSQVPSPVVPNVALGDPFGSGAQIAYTTCQPGPVVVLYTFTVFAMSSVSEVRLTTRAHEHPSAPHFDCPALTLCDAPVYGRICVEGLSACINAASTCCVLPVAPAQWTGMKALYR